VERCRSENPPTLRCPFWDASNTRLQSAPPLSGNRAHVALLLLLQSPMCWCERRARQWHRLRQRLQGRKCRTRDTFSIRPDG
jgi:hypothetical protein